MGFGGIALTSMRSSAVCGVVDFVGISLPRCLGSAPKLLGRVRRLLRLGSSERFVGDVRRGPEPVSSACVQWFPWRVWSGVVMFIQKVHQRLHVALCSVL